MVPSERGADKAGRGGEEWLAPRVYNGLSFRERLLQPLEIKFEEGSSSVFSSSFPANNIRFTPHCDAHSCPPSTRAFRNLGTSVQQHASFVCPAPRPGHDGPPLLLILAWALSILSSVLHKYQTFSAVLKTACHRTLSWATPSHPVAFTVYLKAINPRCVSDSKLMPTYSPSNTKYIICRYKQQHVSANQPSSGCTHKKLHPNCELLYILHLPVQLKYCKNWDLNLPKLQL